MNDKTPALIAEIQTDIRHITRRLDDMSEEQQEQRDINLSVHILAESVKQMHEQYQVIASELRSQSQALRDAQADRMVTKWWRSAAVSITVAIGGYLWPDFQAIRTVDARVTRLEIIIDRPSRPQIQLPTDMSVPK